MEIKIQIRKRVFNISFGYHTKFMGNMNFINVIEEYYDDAMQVVYAELLWHS